MLPGSHTHWCRWGQHVWRCGHLICELPYSIGCEKCNKEKLK